MYLLRGIRPRFLSIHSKRSFGKLIPTTVVVLKFFTSEKVYNFGMTLQTLVQRFGIEHEEQAKSSEVQNVAQKEPQY